MTAIDEALAYAEQVPVFPCIATGPRRKRPYVPRGFHNASRIATIITAWWRRWPDALIGMPTGRMSGRWVLDIDVKDPAADGFDTLEDLGLSILPETPVVHTASGGLHVYFDAGPRELRNSCSKIGPGLDVRGDGGYVILPSPHSGYVWDPLYNFETVAPARAPDWLWPPRPSRPPCAGPIAPTAGLRRYGEAAITAACNAIVRAPNTEQEVTLNTECFSIGTLAGAGAVPADMALRALLRATAAMPDYDPQYPWRTEEVEAKVRRAFNDGRKHPREARRGTAA